MNKKNKYEGNLYMIIKIEKSSVRKNKNNIQKL